MSAAAVYAAAVVLLAPVCRTEAIAGKAVQEARRLREEGDRDLAIAALESARSRGADSPFLYGLLGICYSEEERYEEAIALLEPTLNRLKTDDNGGHSWQLRAARSAAEEALFRSLVASQRMQAVRNFKEAHPGYLGPYTSVLLAHGHVDMAEELAEKELELQAVELPEWRRQALQIAWVVCAIGRGDYKEALARLDKVGDKTATGRAAVSKILIEECASRFGAVRASDNGKSADWAVVQLASAYLRLGLAAAAAEHLNQVLDRGAVKASDVLPLLGQALEGQDRRRDALDVWREAVAAAPDDVDLRLRLARGLKAAGEFDIAAHQIETVLERDPARWQGFVLLGDIARRQGQEPRACEAYRNAILKMADGRFDEGTRTLQPAQANPIDDVLRACRYLAELSSKGPSSAEDELLAWRTVLDLAHRPGRQEYDPPPDWLAERARYRIFRLTGEVSPPLPDADIDRGGMFIMMK